MAAIVAQITKANWERKKKRRKYVANDKCVYYLPPFDDCFHPEKHNVYLRRRAEYERRHREEKEYAELQEVVQLLRKRQQKDEAANVKVAKAVVGATVVTLPLGMLVYLLLTFCFVSE